jgi:hypothetical protein
LLQAKCTSRNQLPSACQQKVQLLDEHFDAVELSGTFRDSRMVDYFEVGRFNRIFVTELLKGEHNIAQIFLKICSFGNMKSSL